MPCASRRPDRHVIPADNASVRHLLERLERGPTLAGLSATERDCTLLVLAEAMNNVVEHGYAGGPGWRLLGDSFAVCMILLGLSGLWLWLRGRSAKTITAGIVGTSAVATAVVLISNLL